MSNEVTMTVYTDYLLNYSLNIFSPNIVYFMALGINQVTYSDREFCRSVLVLLLLALSGKLGQ